MNDARVILIPVLLVTAGVILLIGCIPIPATHQLQPNGKPRPEWAVGAGADKPVRLGHTRIEDAVVELSKRTQTQVRTSGWTRVESRTVPRWSILRWRVSPDGRQFSMPYSIRKATWVMPLCFSAEPETAQRWLTLDINDAGIVTAARTSKQPPTLDPTPLLRWLEVFDEAQRRRLFEAGYFPSEEELHRAEEGQQQIRMRTRRSPPATSR